MKTIRVVLVVAFTLIFTAPLTASAQDVVFQEVHAALDQTKIAGAGGKPTFVSRGVFTGLSLPIWNAGANNDEEINYCLNVPFSYSGTQDIEAHVDMWLDTANTDKKFQMQLEWDTFTAGEDVVPDTTHTVTIEVDTGTAAQYQSFDIEFIIDFDIDSADPIQSQDVLGFRLRRIAATSDEIAGEVVIKHTGVHVPRGDIVGQEAEMAFSILLGLFVFVAAILAGAGLIARKSPLLMMATLVWVLAAWQGFSETSATWDTNYVIGFVTIFAGIGSAILSVFVREKRDEVEVEETPDDIFSEEEPDEETAAAESRREQRQERHEIKRKGKGRRKTGKVREKARDRRFRLTGRL
ncbi:hypothetical protein LCGC14_0744870 [marine sediment metagenome]|uniref:Uncharacterized protein n=1 Tax=marine sediment metagenome TaxID=412755 RepID=A0A0F9Q9X8_9ZZZZ